MRKEITFRLKNVEFHMRRIAIPNISPISLMTFLSTRETNSHHLSISDILASLQKKEKHGRVKHYTKNIIRKINTSDYA